MTHLEAEALVPLLAIDALPYGVEPAVRGHVAVCRSCSELLSAYEDTAGDLALLAPPLTPPPSLRAGIMAALDTPERPDVSGRSRSAGLARRPVTTEAPRQAPAGPAGWWLHVAVGVAAAACLLLGIAYFSFDAVMEAGRRKEAVIAEQREALALVAGDPAITMASTDGTGREGRVHVGGAGRAAVVLTGLGEPRGGVWELWGIRDGVPSPLATVTKADVLPTAGWSRVIVLVDADWAQIEGVALSLEPAVPAPDATGPGGPVVLASS